MSKESGKHTSLPVVVLLTSTENQSQIKYSKKFLYFNS